MRFDARWSAVLVLLGACRSPGPYGYAQTYAPTGEERAAAAGARDYDPVMFAREPARWRSIDVSLFGVVTSRGPGPGGASHLTLSVRRVEPRNVCTNRNDEDTCRVTVTERDFGVVHALVALRPDDEVGERSVGVGSLVRVIGRFGEDVDPNDGAPIVRARFYRHWPRHFWTVPLGAAR